MNPTTRKMFKSRDARNTLRGMGGILASSPELSQTVQQFQDGGNVTAGFGSNPEYTYGTFLAENNLNDTPQAREMFAKYKVYMDTREVPTDPQLFSDVGFDQAPMIGDAPMTSAVAFDPSRQFSQTNMDTPMGLSGVDAGSAPSVDTASFPQPETPSILDQFKTFDAFGIDAKARRAADQFKTFDAFGIDAKARRVADLMGATDDEKTALLFPDGNRGVPVVQPSDVAPTDTSYVPPLMGPTEINSPAMRTAVANVPAPVPQSDSFLDLSNSIDGLNAREAAFQNAGRMSAQEKMLAELSDVAPTASENLLGRPSTLSGSNFSNDPTQGYSFPTDVPPEDEKYEGRDVIKALQESSNPAELDTALNTIQAEREAEAQKRLDTTDGTRAARTNASDPVVETAPEEVVTPVVTDAVGGASAEKVVPPVLSEEVIKKVNDPKVQEEAAALTPSPNDTEDDLRSKYDARAKLFREILGEDEAGARNKGMDLAMIGLAIMSGQSPNALTNIAQGGAAGLQAMSARDEAARERQRLVRTTALESVLDEEAAGTAAAATAAEKALDRQNRLDAGLIANSTDLDTKTGEVTYRSLFQEAYKVATDLVNMPPEVRSGEMTAVEYATKIAKAARAGSKGQTVPGPTTTIADPAAVDAAIKSRVDAAKNNPATLAAIKQSLITKGMDPSKYGLK